MGLVNALLVLALNDACELSTNKVEEEMYARVPQEDEGDGHNSEAAEHQHDDHPDIEAASPTTSQPTPRTWKAKTKSWFSSRFSQISASTRSIMYKLWFLLAVDSLADGMVPYSLTNYYMDVKFHPFKSTLGDVTSLSYFFGAIGAVFAGPLARNIGLINTMVFTHVPSSAAVLFFPFPPYFWMTAGLLLVRAGLNNMDQAPRTAFIAAVVKPEERTAVMGITGTLRNLAAMTGPTVTGLLAENEKFGIAFIVAGVCRLAYDFGLYAMFVNMKLHQHESKPETVGLPNGRQGHEFHRDDRGEVVELHSLADPESTPGVDGNGEGTGEIKANSPKLVLQVPVADERVRSRSPRRSTAMD